MIFEDASVTLNTDQKAGFIGRNGAGKSTLCKIITGENSADGGEIIKSSDLQLSYLEQHDPFTDEETVVEFLERYTGRPAWRCGQVAARFQMKTDILETRVRGLSGGYQTRVKLTAMLLREPNFLILDEPSNYLDLKTLILLEEFLQDFRGGFIIVSHDREFLMKTCDHTLEAENGKLELYPGNVEDYLEYKKEQGELIAKTNQTILGKKKQLQQFVDRFRAKASKARQARSKMKQIEKLKTIDTGESQANVRIHIPAGRPRHGIAFRCEDLAIGYPEKLVATRINLNFDHGSHIGILGDNGQGKTTFMKTIAGDLEKKSGSMRWGYGCEPAYYAQHVVTQLNPEHDVYTHLELKAAQDVTKEEILAMAGCFLFRDTDVNKSVSVLSGGERARLCLAGLLLMKRNVLLLDEPTNHLDFETVEALGSALRRFKGTVFFISHDRTFVNMVATEIVEVSNGSVRTYPGSYADYVYRMETEVHRELTQGAGATKKESEEKSEKAARKKERKQRDHAKRELRKDIKRCERELNAVKEKKQTLEAQMAADPAACTHENATLYEELERDIDAKEEDWLKLQEKFESMDQAD